MSIEADALHLLKTRRKDYSLPQAFYSSQEIFDLDMRHIFGRNWLFVALSCEVPLAGSWVTVKVGVDSVVIVRGHDNEIRAFFNTCRHRGSQVCVGESGKAKRLVCPYHQWSYDLDGSLARARFMDEDFNPKEFGLKPVALENIAGYLFISLAENPPDFSAVRRDLEPFIKLQDIENCKVAHSQTLVENANWKLVIENNRECYHCNGSHPELLRTLAVFDSDTDPRVDQAYRDLLARYGAKWEGLGLPHEHTPYSLQHRAIRLPFLEGALSMTMDGGLASKKLLGNFTDPDLGSVRMLSLPNSWNHLLSDHFLAFRVMPLGPQLTEVVTKWVVHKDAVEGVDYDLHNLTHVWDETNVQDKVLAEDNQRGINSRAYQPGPYSSVVEGGVRNFISWYTDELEGELERKVAPMPRMAAE